MKGMKQSEKTLCKSAVAYVNKLPGCFASKRFGGAGSKGKADITGAIHGLRFELEAKVGSNKPTELQKKWLEKAKKAKCIAAAFWTMDEFRWIINAHVDVFRLTGTLYALDLPLDDQWRLPEGLLEVSFAEMYKLESTAIAA